MRREHRIAQVFIELADTLVAEFDLVEFLRSLAEVTVELLDVDAARLMLADEDGVLRVMASSDDQAELLELFELQQDDGPCPGCFRTGQPVVNVDIRRWPEFAEAAAAGGYASAHALPLRLRGHVIGALNLFRSSTEPLGEEDVNLGQALADIATIGLLHEREVRSQQVLTEQLQHALDSRVLIEQGERDAGRARRSDSGAGVHRDALVCTGHGTAARRRRGRRTRRFARHVRTADPLATCRPLAWFR